jgi:hypothetical protein
MAETMTDNSPDALSSQLALIGKLLAAERQAKERGYEHTANALRSWRLREADLLKVKIRGGDPLISSKVV